MNFKIKEISISNFKAYKKKNFKFNDSNQVIIGENDAGKSSVLEALDFFFNEKEIPIEYVRHIHEDVIIGVFINNKFYKKIFSRVRKNSRTYKLVSKSKNIKDLNKLSYLFIKANSENIEKVFQELVLKNIIDAIPKKIINELNKISMQKYEEILDSIIAEDFSVTEDYDENFIPESHNETHTMLGGGVELDFKRLFNVIFESRGVRLNAKGSGYKKSVLYSLLINNTKAKYENIILGIDEIENSFSLNSVRKLIKILQQKYSQIFITTHSPAVLSVALPLSFQVYPLYLETTSVNNFKSFNKEKTLAELLISLDPSKKEKFLIVEGVTDSKWILKALSFLDHKKYNYVVIPGGGDNSIHLQKLLILHNKECHIILDGDKNSPFSLTKEIIEMYTPIEVVNEKFNLNLSVISKDKNVFFKDIINNKRISKDTIKAKLSNWAYKELNRDNPIINEIKSLLDKQLK